MIQPGHSEDNKQGYYRLVALWVICEAFAGGIMHAAKLPFTGLIVSSLAITCIVLIAYHVPTGSAIIKATVIVAIFKLMLSPHSPPTAYLAVFFQGLMGQLLLNKRRYFVMGAITLATLALVESAIQRILVLLIFSGTDFWDAVNLFIQKTTGKEEVTNYSFWLALAYIIIHGLAGIFVGFGAARLAQTSANWEARDPSLVIEGRDTASNIFSKKTGHKRKIKLVFILALVVLAVLYIQSYLDPRHAIIPSSIILNIVLRSILIILIWYLVLGPVIMLLIKRALRNKQQKYQTEINKIFTLLPGTKYIFRQSFKLSGSRRGMERVKLFLKILLVNVLTDQQV